MKSATDRASDIAPGQDRQTIARLTPLARALPALAALVRPVGTREIDMRDALHRVLAADAIAPLRPARASALRDGFAVRAADTADAGGYAPVALSPPQRVETGDELPDGTDAVAPDDTIVLRAGAAEAVAAVAPGDGVLPAGGDTDPAQPLCKTGECLRAIDIATLEAAGITRVTVRAPRLLLVPAREDVRLTPVLGLIARAATQHGADVAIRNGLDPDAAFHEAGFDAVIVVGGSGAGARDRSVALLARAGELVCHGIGLTPGETAAFGRVGTRPVLVVPGRLDAALAVWMVVGRALLRGLAAGGDEDATIPLPLTRKIVSTVGLAEVVPVRRRGHEAEPLAGGFLPLKALARADGFVLVPADSEGYPAGAPVAIHLWR